MRVNTTDRVLNIVRDYELQGKRVTELGAQIVFLESRLSKEQPKKKEKTNGTEPLDV